MDQPSGTTPLRKEQKIGVALIVVFGIVSIGLGTLQLRNTIYNPFAPKTTNTTNQELSALFASDEARLQQLDTDKDGLSDYDELTYHNTSAYLPDTDSDGIQDKDEVAAGTDPACAEGTVCESVQEDPAKGATETLFKDPGPPPQAGGTGTADTGGTLTQAQIEALLEDPTALRKILLESGQMTQAQLDGISDAALVAAARASMEDATTGTSTTP